MPSVKLYHATTKKNLASILEKGLLVSCADKEARIKGVWLHTKSMSRWAILHTQKRHKAQLEDVIILEISISKKHLKKFKSCLYFSICDVAPCCIKGVSEALTFAKGANE